MNRDRAFADAKFNIGASQLRQTLPPIARAATLWQDVKAFQDRTPAQLRTIK